MIIRNKKVQKAIILSISLLVIAGFTMTAMHFQQKSKIEGEKYQIQVNSVIITDHLQSSHYSVLFGVKYDIFLGRYSWENIVSLNRSEIYDKDKQNILESNQWHSSEFIIDSNSQPSFTTTVCFRLKQHFTISGPNAFESYFHEVHILPTENFLVNTWLNTTINGSYHFGGFVQISYIILGI